MKRWFIWWIVRPSEPQGGHWYGPVYRTDYEAFQEQLAIYKGTPGIEGIYRWFWEPPMPTWQYDDRPNSALISQSVQFAWL